MLTYNMYTCKGGNSLHSGGNSVVALRVAVGQLHSSPGIARASNHELKLDLHFTMVLDLHTCSIS